MEAINMPVHLVIKAPNQKIEDQVIHCDLEWNVQRVKSYLSEVYPNNPKVEEQKLIYCGRLLHNHLKLKDVLRYEDGQTHTLHLVCTSKDPFSLNSQPSTEEPSSSNSQNQPSVSNAQSAFTHHVSSQSSLSSLNDDHQRFNSHQPSQSIHFPQLLQVNSAVQPFPFSPEMITQQMAAMQQLYAQYLAQYMQYVQSAGVPLLTQAITPQTTHQPPPSQPPPVPAEGINNGVNQGAPVPPRPANENVRMNAQGGPLLDDDDDDVGNRDWLDWFYILSRTLVLFTIVYFYSSPGRFMIVTGITVLAYLYQGGWLGVRRPGHDQARNQEPRQNQRNEDVPQPNQNVPVVINEQNQQAREQIAEDAQEMEHLMDGDLQHYREQRENEENRGSPFLTAWTFISSFFSSLIPEQPAPVNIN